MARISSFREFQEGIAIDPPESDHPEGTFTATRHDNPKDRSEPAYFNFAVSYADTTVLDPNLASIADLINTIGNTSPREVIDPELPGQRGQFAFSQQRTIPSTTLRGVHSKQAGGFVDFSLVQTRSRPDLFAPDDPDLQRNRQYITSAQLAKIIRRDSSILGRPGRPIHPDTVKTTMGHVMSIGIAQLALEGKMPVLLFPNRKQLVVRQKDGSKKTLDAVHVTPNPTPLLPYEPHATIDIVTSSTRPRRLRTRQWVNAMLISHYLETGESFIGIEEANLLATWFNWRKVMKETAKHGAEAVDAEMFIDPGATEAA